MSFLFSNAESASRQAFLLLVLLLLIPMIVEIVQGDEGIPDWVNWIYALFPPICIYKIFANV
jgi:hypothetical protein